MEIINKNMLLLKRCNMNKIILYKNNNIVFEKTGTIKNNIFQVDNINFDIEKCILTREDDNFKYELDFQNNNALVIMKLNNYSLNLILDTKEIIKTNEKITIKYYIESDDKISNQIDIILN